MRWDIVSATNRFNRYFSPGEPGKCWPWRGPKNKKGYGVLGINYRVIYAHRISFAIANKVKLPPSSTFICHSCDNPICVNPEHLFAGNREANHMDAVKKGRANFSCGESNQRARLTEQQVKYVREKYIPFSREWGARALARKLGVGASTMRSAIKGINWRHLK